MTFDPVLVMILEEMRRVNRKLASLESRVEALMERIGESPLPAKIRPNCSGYYIGIRCESCKWTEADDDAEEVDEPTDEEPTQPEPPALDGTHC